MATIHLTAQGFKDNIFNYETEQEWKFKGDKAAIVDFYADWCGPCKSIAPVLEELSDEYKDKLVIYKIDTDKEMNCPHSLVFKAFQPCCLFRWKAIQ